MKVVKQDPQTHGSFFSGDSYIVLVTKKPPNSPKLEWDIHFWLGKDTSQDEQGVAAYKTVELDDSLGGAPVQHREVQDHESKLFLSYFRSGIRYLEGGVDSGFKKVERDKYETRLMQIKGKRHVRVRQVKCDHTSLNQGDVFILDCGLMIYVWNGPQSSKMERIKGIEVAKRINDEERGGKAAIKIIENTWNSDPGFFKALGSTGDIPLAADGGDDTEFERVEQDTVTLYRVSDASGKLEVSEVGQKPLKREHLDSNDCFILDSGPSGIYVWTGKKCTKNEKSAAWQNATEFLKMRGYPEWTSVTQVVEEGETPLFKQYFASWTDKNAQRDWDEPTAWRRWQVSCLVFRQKRSHLETFIWRVEHNDLVAQPEDTFGTFYTGDCYLVLHTYTKGTSSLEQYTLYFWQGGINNTEPISDVRLFQVRGTNSINTKAMQVQPRASSLNSNDVFILESRDTLILWRGRGASEDEKLVANNVMNFICPDRNAADLMVFDEGEELPVFWDLLGGPESYATERQSGETVADMPTRLFQCSNASGRFLIEEIVDFCQEDLCEDDVMLLDTYTEIFVWVGKGANETEKKEALHTAMEYIRTDPSGRTEDNTLILQVKQGFEPTSFTGHFHGWDPEKWSGGKTYEDLKKEFGEDSVAVTSVQEELANYYRTYTYAELTKKSLPKGVDASCKERYLSDQEFSKVFGISRSEYLALREWKQINLKKKVGLF
ncbi:hypothetical protein C0Q70_00427 [Pomacea canaliculata]|uniref:HP domain-containing protein n=1 Tax=Pomacea canaliculata TaxID=400727 RepID=A0A2T7PWL2_POMCA|nr:hypothetical protein C0Q70_00427 [Pomacea canaliculata]